MEKIMIFRNQLIRMEFSTVSKVQQILASLDADKFAVVPYDVFFRALNAAGTFRDRFG